MIRAVCFDFGGVYKVHPHEEHTWRDMWRDKQDEIGKEFPFGIFVEMQRKLDTGKVTLRNYYIQLFRKIGKKYTREEIKKYSKFSFRKAALDPKIQQLVFELKRKGYKVPLVSNTIKESARRHKKSGDYAIFSTLFISCEVGHSKSDGSIYPFVCKNMRLKPEECLMIDDNPDYLKTAEKRGWKTILYRNPEQLKYELRRMKVL